MSEITRRNFAKLAGLAGAGVLSPAAWTTLAIARTPGRVVIVGGGAGGATTAHYLKRGAPELDVTLIEANPIYSSSFFSNLYIGGLRRLESLNHAYGGLAGFGVKVVHDVATDVNPSRKTVRTRGGRTYHYDRLVLSPGIDIKYDSIAGYSRRVARIMPHAYTTDARQKRLLRRHIKRMRDGGTVVMAVPNNPYRCPPAPYERACMIAHYLKSRKPRSKLIIFDPKMSFSKQSLFIEAFQTHYKGIVELNLTNEIDDFSVVRVNSRTKEIVTKAGHKVKADVANVIPQQRAGKIAARAGCTEGDWCPINPENFTSRKVKDVYVLGDASIAAEMPKSAFAANSQAKVVAADILAELAGMESFPPRYRNTCWSLLAPDDDVKIGADYEPKDGKLQSIGGFISQTGEPREVRKENYLESVGWYDRITAEMFARPGVERGGRAQKRR
jgi:sulfide dehydrogenase [flavocytochrome c] flavoprotein chain